MVRIRFSEADRKLINAAVARAEEKTSGEIATAIIRESYDYAIYELILAVVTGFAYFLILLFFTSRLELWLQNLLWDYSVQYLLAFYGFSTFAVITAVYFLANLTFIDRIIVPARIRKRKVRERALRYFMEAGVNNTRDRSGILIFISLLERRVELLADSGINSRISPGLWQNFVDDITAGIRKNELVPALEKAVLDCGHLLAEYFPISADDVNELQDGITILEK
ncbi:MAG: TPM domain-containing protein [Candidatus Cloacimonetes bacterium]|nr:TPM domain-containing protein [Candidatus Cloacimonadota bacterium]